MSESEIRTEMTTAKFKQQLESLSLNMTVAEDVLDGILRAAEAVKDETAEALARATRSSFAATKGLVDAAGEECRRLEGLGSQITEETRPAMKAAGVPRQIREECSVKVSEILSQCVNRLTNEELRCLLGLTSNLTKSLLPNNPAHVMNELGKKTSAAGLSAISLDTLSGVEFWGLVSRLVPEMDLRFPLL